MTIMKMPVHPETHWGWVLWCVDGFLAIFWLNEKFFGLRLTPAPQVHSIPFASKERARERERERDIYIYGVASKFGYGSARGDPNVWNGLDHLRFGMDRGYGSACGFRVWIGALHFDSQPYIYIYIWYTQIHTVWSVCMYIRRWRDFAHAVRMVDIVGQPSFSSSFRPPPLVFVFAEGNYLNHSAKLAAGEKAALWITIVQPRKP